MFTADSNTLHCYVPCDSFTIWVEYFFELKIFSSKVDGHIILRPIKQQQAFFFFLYEFSHLAIVT